MAISTVAELLAGLQPAEDFIKILASPAPNFSDVVTSAVTLFYDSGRPGATTGAAPGLAGDALTSVAGQIPWRNPATGSTYLAQLSAGFVTASSGRSYAKLLLLDRLWHNGGIVVTTTTSQTVNSVAWPARDRNGSANGEDVMVALEASSPTGAVNVTNTTISYTNAAGTSGRTATLPLFNNNPSGRPFVTFALDAGDTGIRSIQSITLGTSYVSGALRLVAYRKVAELHIHSTLRYARSEAGPAQTQPQEDALTLGRPRLFDDSVLFLVYARGSSFHQPAPVGGLRFTQG